MSGYTLDSLIARLSALREQHGGETEVMILDGFNGGGAPRTINLGPKVQQISEADADDTGDCEDRQGETVIAMGYGCY